MTEVDLMQLVTTGEHDEVLTTSRIVATEFGKRHDHVMRDIRAFKEDVPNFGEMFYEDKAKDSYGRDQKIFDMTRDGFSLLAMGFNGKKALQFKLKFIEAFNKMEQQLKSLSSTQSLPKTLPEALRAYADEVEHSNKLLEQNEAMQENYSFGTDLSTSKDSEPVGNFAKQLKQKGIETSQNKLFAWFREHKYLMSATGQRHNLPTQKAMQDELFELKAYTYYDNSKNKHTKYTTLVTVKGQKYFLDKFLHSTD